MRKGKTHSIRLNIEHLEFARGHFGTDSVQEIVDILLRRVYESENDKAKAIRLMIECLEGQIVPSHIKTKVGRVTWERERNDKLKAYKNQLNDIENGKANIS